MNNKFTLEKKLKELQRRLSASCECDNTHKANDTECILCLYKNLLKKGASQDEYLEAIQDVQERLYELNM